MKKSIASDKMVDYKKMKWFLIVFSFSLFFGIQLTAQDIKFYKVVDGISKTSAIKNDKDIDMATLESHLNDLNPTIYLTTGNKRIYGNGAAIVLESDTQSFDELYKINSAFNQVETIKLKLTSENDLNSILNLDELKSFYRLKYIYAEFDFNVCDGQNDACLLSKIKNMIKGSDSNVIVLYKLSIPN